MIFATVSLPPSLSSALSLHPPCCHCCLFLRTAPFLSQEGPRPFWVKRELWCSLGITFSFGMVKAWHHWHECMFLQSSTALFITTLISILYQHWWQSWNNPTISNSLGTVMDQQKTGIIHNHLYRMAQRF